MILRQHPLRDRVVRLGSHHHGTEAWGRLGLEENVELLALAVDRPP